MSETRSIVIRRVFAAPRARLFEAWSRPELMAQWFFPAPEWRAEVTAEVRPQGRYRVVMYDPAGNAHAQHGVYLEVQPVSRLVFTWTCSELGVEDSLVTLELSEAGEGTELILTHRLPDEPHILREHEEGWKGCLGGLQRFLDVREERA